MSRASARRALLGLALFLHARARRSEAAQPADLALEGA
jgi:hypothetical protein